MVKVTVLRSVEEIRAGSTPAPCIITLYWVIISIQQTIMETSKNLDAFNFYPNPATDELTFKIKATKNDKSILNIYNAIGAITIKKEIYLT